MPTRNQKHLLGDSNLTYKDFQNEMNLINRAYYEIMTEGDKTGQPFTFPIPTVNITEDFDWYGENTDLLFENTAKIGSSYFQNFIGSQYIRDKNGTLIPNEDAYKPSHARSVNRGTLLPILYVLAFGFLCDFLFSSLILTFNTSVEAKALH